MEPLPAWVVHRNDQAQAATEIVEAFTDTDVVYATAPTGAGKTLVGDLVRRGLGAGRTVYLCCTNTLLAQMVADFSYAAPIRGRANYPVGQDGITAADCTALGSKSAVPCAECERRHAECAWCVCKRSCPYEIAKRRAYDSPFPATNYAFFLTETNGPGKLTHHGDDPFNLVICDEGDRVPEELSRHTEIRISPRMMRQLELDPPTRKTVESSWPGWFTYAIAHIKTRMPRRSEDVTVMRYRRTLERLVGALEAAAPEVGNGEWLYRDYERGAISFVPVYVRRHAQMLLWPHGQKWLFLSATLIPQMTAGELGNEDYAVVEMASTFPPERRPIYYKATAAPSHRNADETWPQLARTINDIIATYPNDRVLIHSVSYRFSRYLMEVLDSRRAMTYNNAAERDKALASFRGRAAAVFVAPGMERGIDLPFDDCRVVILPKVMFPSLGDKLVQKRLHGPKGQFWYNATTIQSIVQSAGRAMRDVNDACDIWCLDEHFLRLYRRERRLFPGWFREAVRMDGSAMLRERQRKGEDVAGAM